MVPDSVAGQILDSLVPKLRAEDYDGAVITAVDELIGYTQGGVSGTVKRTLGGFGEFGLHLLLLILGATGLALGSVSRVWLAQIKYKLKVVIAVVCLGIMLPASSGDLLLLGAQLGAVVAYIIAWIFWFLMGALLGEKGLWLSYVLVVLAVVAVSLSGVAIIASYIQPVVMWPSLALLTWTIFFMSGVLAWVSEQDDAPRAATFWSGFFQSGSGGGSHNTIASGGGSSGGSSFGGGGGSFGGGGASGSW